MPCDELTELTGVRIKSFMDAVEYMEAPVGKRLGHGFAMVGMA